MKIILNKTKSSSQRFTLLSGAMGNYGEPRNSPNHYYEIVNGVDRGRGYQGYMSITYALSDRSSLPEEIKRTIQKEIKKLRFNISD